ncbi:MAG: alpha/beta fold hydrolase, partial [Synechococcales cyanobacterium RU_4_20]|nr:alpha/beta fold hydrolase [Synechococcales cyanobacterium RU_4_20]
MSTSPTGLGSEHPDSEHPDSEHPDSDLSLAPSALALPGLAAQLTEPTSIALAQAIQFEAIATPLRPEPIPTAYSSAHASQALKDRTEAPPLLLIHGFDSSQFEFRRLLPLLAGGAGGAREVWLMDLLGFGFSDRPTDIPLNPDTIKTHLHAFWQQKIGRPVVLVGASMGGAAAIDFALSYPNQVDRLVLLDSAGYQNGPVIGKFLFSPVDQWAVEFLRRPDVRRKISLNAYFAGDRLVTPDAELCARLHLEMPGW